ncbi:torsin-1A-interacting protein 2 isoform X2 [Xenopus laevis]|uniref:Torsin-1A-interacting protein 2 isoform X2 n=2 Tax=Xenopus laevis TaxID=8355 RepID=A0A1L8GG46_XENLA|nr:torsin-1A-interacting protein 2 isoform X2 [Xenopus laevis]OCT82820.1 hypothetical protein XELAEV_18025354mg [Xenopus laevis]
MDSGESCVEEKDKGNAGEDRFPASGTLNCSNPPDSSVSGTDVTEEDGGSRSSGNLETKIEAQFSVSQRLPSAEQDKEDKGHTEPTIEDSVAPQKESLGEGNKDTPNTTTESKSDVEFGEEKTQIKSEPTIHTNSTQSAACLERNIQNVPVQNEKLYDEEQTAENRQTIEDSGAPQKESLGESNKDTPTTTTESKSDVEFRDEKTQIKSERTIHTNSTQSAACLERNKQNVPVQNEKLYDGEQTAENRQTIEDSGAPQKESPGESNTDTPTTTTESKSDVEFEEEKTQIKSGPTLHTNSTQSAACLERNKQNVPVQNEKLYDGEQTAENRQTIEDSGVPQKESLRESNTDTPTTTTESKNDVDFREKPNLNPNYTQTTRNPERNKEIATEKENEQKPSDQSENENQHSDSPKDPNKNWPRKRPAAVKSGSDKDQQAAPQITEPIEEVGAICAEEEQSRGEVREKKGTVCYVASFAAGIGGVVLLIVFLYLYCFGSTPSSDSTPVMKFLKEFEKLKAEFPGQNEALWLRSGKMLQRHLNKSQPLEPATLILTAAQDGEHTLRCLSIGLAKAYATSLNSSWNLIDGPSKAAYDSTTTKLQVDETLCSGFESTCRAAVLHRIEELAPESLLILYKYCDHENAVFKNVALVLTVLLKQSTLKSDQTLTEVEEQVKDFLWEKCTSQGSGNSYNEMNVDKMSGVWSRISHLVLPVYPVESLESGSCTWS